MLGIIEQVLKIIAYFVGDAVLTKWIGAFYLFMRHRAEPKIREEAEAQYKMQHNLWLIHKDDRQKIKPQEHSEKDLFD